MNFFNYVSVIPNCISKDLIKVFLDLKFEDVYPATTLNAIEGYRVTNWIDLPPEIISNTITSLTNYYNSELIKVYKQPVKFIEPPQFLYYNVGGKYDLHNDSEDYVNGKLARTCERDVTILIYLNDNYEGGELELPDWGITFKPKAGTLIAFPSYLEFSHKVNPVTKGKRFTIVSWICTEERIYSRPY